jgi:hypothetical protein
MSRRAVLAFGLVAILVLAVPALASASWTHKGKGELKENASVTATGELTVTTSVGKVTCPTSIGATLTASSSAGDVNSYTVPEPSKCDLTESIGAVCGTHGVSKVEKTGTWGLTAKESTIEISSIDLHVYFGKCLIPNFRVKGTATATPDKTTAMNTLTLSGSQTLYNSLGEEVGTASLGGSPSVSPAGTYGVKTAPLVKTNWFMSGAHLSKTEEMTLNGSFSFSYEGGTVTCTASVVLSLTAGEVEEEEPEGTVKTFTVAKPEECTLGGALGTLCGAKSVSSVEKTGTWTVTATKSDISVSNVSLDYKFSKCAISALRLGGGATLTVSNPSEIKEATFSGSPSIYNSEEEEVGTAELGGTATASPSGTYALTRPQWTDNKEPLSSNAEISATGTFEFETILGGVHCKNATFVLDLEKESAAGTLLAVEMNEASECHGSGSITGCTVSKGKLTTSLKFNQTGATLSVAGVKLWMEYAQTPGESEECGVEEAEVHFTGSQTLTLGLDPNLAEIKSLTLSAPNGGVLTAFGLEVAGVGVAGELTIDSPNDGTYGIG